MSKTKTKIPFSEKIGPLVAPVFFLTLIAVSSFVLGQGYRRANQVTTVSADRSTKPPAVSTNDQSTISVSAPATTSADTTTSSPAATTTSAVPSSTASATGSVDINTADLTMLETLDGIGPTKAQAIIDYRTQNGPFQSVNDLLKVKGIGSATLGKIQNQVTL